MAISLEKEIIKIVLLLLLTCLTANITDRTANSY